MAARAVAEDEETTLGALLLARGGHGADAGAGVDGGREDGRGSGEDGEARRGGRLGLRAVVADADDDRSEERL